MSIHVSRHLVQDFIATYQKSATKPLSVTEAASLGQLLCGLTDAWEELITPASLASLVNLCSVSPQASAQLSSKPASGPQQLSTLPASGPQQPTTESASVSTKVSLNRNKLYYHKDETFLNCRYPFNNLVFTASKLRFSPTLC